MNSRSKNVEKVVIRGLEGVVAAETDISFVDGENSEIYYKGYNIHDIAKHTTSYTEITYLLLYGELPTKKELNIFRRRIISEMRVPTQIINMMEMIPQSSPPMNVLRTAVSMLSSFDPDIGDDSPDSTLHKGIRLIAQIPTLVASLYRIRNKMSILSPDPKLNVAANILYMFHGEIPDEKSVRAMDLLLLLHADHGLNASTFAARVTTSTNSDIHSAITSAIGTLKGPLHGGANERVMKMLQEIIKMDKLSGVEKLDDVEEYIDTLLSEGKRVMGFGHRIFKKEDPRARHLRILSEELCSLRGNKKLFNISHRVEKAVMKKKGIYPNVDFYSAIVLHALNIPIEFYTTIFASARISGWVAHIIEQYGDNRLIRPTSKYTGQYNRKFLPIEKRRNL
ncbi:citrate/2-methylcitrate synthase [Candidatus Latescibacterota bacterium]